MWWWIAGGIVLYATLVAAILLLLKAASDADDLAERLRDCEGAIRAANNSACEAEDLAAYKRVRNKG